MDLSGDQELHVATSPVMVTNLESIRKIPMLRSSRVMICTHH